MEGHFEHERRFPRLSRHGRLLYSERREARSAELADISQGGIGIRGLRAPLVPGSALPVTVCVGLNRVGPLAARVVWSHADRAGLELAWQDPEVACRIAQAIRNLEPI